ncbi:MAG: DsbA family protein [Nanoarchaeota archaeon]
MAEESVTLKKSTIWKASTGVLAVLLLISIITGGFGIGSGSDSGPTGRAVAPSPSPSPNPIPVPSIGLVEAKDFVDDDPVLGEKNAPVTIVEFSDFQCPFCGRFRSQTLTQIEKEYIDTGKVKFVFRDFPLNSIHPYAQKASEASECADDQGKFWEYHDVLFENQASLDLISLKKYAADLELDTGDFNNCLDSGKYADEVKKDTADAQAAGGTGTPFFLIGNRPVSGAQPYANFKAAIDAQL